MVETIFQSPIFTEIILPFLLVFAIIFAILEKSKILGDGKRQIDAIVSFVIALIFVSYSYATGIVSKLMPFLAVAAVVIIVFMILFAMVFVGKDSFEMNKGLKITFGVLIALGVVIVLLWATGLWDKLYAFFMQGEDTGSALWANILIIAAIVVAIVVAFKSEGTAPAAEKH